MWDQLVCGLHSEGHQRRLLITKDLTFLEAVETALSMEAAEKDSKTLKRSKDASVNFKDSDIHRLEAVLTLLLI